MKTNRETKAATVSPVAAESDAPDGAHEQLHSNPYPAARQDPLARGGRLQQRAKAAKPHGGYATFWQSRQQFFLLQAVLYGVA
jgi:hypothetical protein